MKRSHLEGEPFDAHDVSNAAFAASMFAVSVGMIWDLATGHVSAFDRMLSDISDDEREAQSEAQARTCAVAAPSCNSDSIMRGRRTDA